MSVEKWKADTLRILSSGGTSVQVRSSTIEYGDIPISLTSTSTLVETATVHIFENRGSLLKDSKGLIAESTHSIFFPFTSTVAVGHTIFENGETDYYKVLAVASYEDHKEISARKVENR